MKNWVIILCCALTLSACNLYKDIEVSEVRNVEIVGFGRDGVEAKVTVEIDNPNGYRLLAQRAEMDVKLNSKPAGVLQFNERFVIPRKSKETYTFTLTGAFAEESGGMLGSLLNILINRDVLLEGEGYVQGRGLFVRRKVPVVFKEKVDMPRR